VIELDAYKGYAYGEADDDEIIVLGNENRAMSSENTIDGGDGVDTLNYSHLEGHIWGGLQTSVNRYGEIDGKGVITGIDTISNVENAVLTTGDDYLSGTNGDNVIRGNAGDDTIYGKEGNDRLYGDEGDDTIYGEDGDDTIFVGQGSDTVDGGRGDDRIIYEDLEEGSSNGENTIDGGDGYDVVDYSNLKQKVEVSYEDGVIKVYKDPANKDANFDTLRNVEGIVGTDFEDTIKGDASDNKLFGGKARDTIYGNDGHDEIYGGAGSDTVYGGSGDDVFHVIDGDTAYGEQGDDSFVIYKDESGQGTEFHGGEGVDTLEYSEVSYGISGNLSDGKFDRTTTYGGSIGVSDVVSDVENVLGTDYNDRIGGNDLDNRIEGNGGNDVLEGRAGEDTLKGGLGDDTLRGGADDDILNGGMGDDTLEGGTGNDTLKGGHGSDTYVFDGRVNGEVDNVYDFDEVSLSSDTGVDTINIKNVLNVFEILFARDGDNLVIKTKAGSRINVVNWFVDDVFKIENIQIYNGERVNLSAEKVELIMEGMALYEKLQGKTCEEAFNSNDGLYTSFIDYLAKEETKEVMDLADDFTFLKEYQNLVENSVKTYTGNFGNIVVDELSELSPSGVGAVGKIEFLRVPNAYNAFEYRYEREGNALTIHAGENSLKIGNWYADGGNKVDIKIYSQLISSEKIDFLVENMEKYEFAKGVTWEQAISENKSDYQSFLYKVIQTEDSQLSSLENRYSFMIEYNKAHNIMIDDEAIFGSVNGGKLDYGSGRNNIKADLTTGEVFVGLEDACVDVGYEGYGIEYLSKVFTEQIKDIDTGSMADKVWGNALDNVINAGDGTNRVFGADGNDTITGGNVRDDLFGGNGDDTIYGGGALDYIVGGAGNDKIYGEEGNDVIEAGSGDDTLDGGAGEDTYRFFKDNAGVNYLGEEYVDSGSFGHDTIADSGLERDRIEVLGYSVNEFSFNTAGEDLVIGVAGEENSITIKNFDSQSDKDYTLKYYYGNGSKEKDLGVLIEQIAAFEGTHGVQWEDVMGMERYQAQQQYGSDVYYAAEQIIL
jgi:Ca2+-binding RTX toxin-like protein